MIYDADSEQYERFLMQEKYPKKADDDKKRATRIHCIAIALWALLAVVSANSAWIADFCTWIGEIYWQAPTAFAVAPLMFAAYFEHMLPRHSLGICVLLLTVSHALFHGVYEAAETAFWITAFLKGYSYSVEHHGETAADLFGWALIGCAVVTRFTLH